MSSLTPLTLLTLSETEQRVVQSLTRQPHQTLAELAEALQVVPDDLEPVLEQMVGAAQLARDVEQGQPRYSVSFALERKPKRSPGNSLLDMFR